MKKFIAIILLGLLLCVSPAQADLNEVVGVSIAPIADPCDTTLCSGCQYQERFECGGEASIRDGGEDDEEQPWVNAQGDGVFDQDYATTPLEGIYGLRVDYNSATELQYFPITGTDNQNYFMYRIELIDKTALEYILAWYDTDGNTIARLYYQVGTDKFRSVTDQQFTENWQTFTNTIAEISTDDIFYLKAAYNNGSGSDTTWDFWLSDNGTSWTLQVDVNDDEDTDQIGRVYTYVKGTDAEVVIDDIRVRTDGTDTGDY